MFLIFKELERYKENLQKNHRHEFGIERARHKDTKRQLDEMTEEMEKLKQAVRVRTYAIKPIIIL